MCRYQPALFNIVKVICFLSVKINKTLMTYRHTKSVQSEHCQFGCCKTGWQVHKISQSKDAYFVVLVPYCTPFFIALNCMIFPSQYNLY
jgi:hypothetical protein